MWTNKPIPLAGGMDVSVGQAHRPGPMLNRLLNATVNTKGEIEKRTAFDALPVNIYDGITAALTLLAASDGGVAPGFKPRALIVDSNRSMGEVNDTLYLLTHACLFKYSASGWIPRDVLAGLGSGILYPTALGMAASTAQVSRSVGDQYATQSVSNLTYTLTCWVEGGVVYYSVTDTIRGGIVVDGGSIGSGVLYVKAVAVWGGDIGFVYNYANSIGLCVLTAPLAPVDYPSVITTSYNTAGVAPLNAAVSHASTIALTYTDTVTNLNACLIDWSGAITAQVAYGGAGTSQASAIAYDSANSVYVIVHNLGVGANNVESIIANTSLVDLARDVFFTTSAAGARSVVRFAIGFNSTLYGDVVAGIPYVHIAAQLSPVAGQVDKVEFFHRLSTGVGTTYGPFTYRRCTLTTDMFNHDNMLYVGLGHRSALQGTMFVVAVGLFNTGQRQLHIAARIQSGLAAGDMDERATNFRGPPSAVSANLDGNSFTTGHRVKSRYDTDTTDYTAYTRSISVKLQLNTPVSSTMVGGFAYIANGSILKQHDGFTVTETGFLLFPEMTAADITATAAVGFLSAGSYTWRFYYETEYAGKRVRSYATTITRTMLANDRANIAVPTLQWTQRANVNIVGYRTKVNPTGDSPFYRVTELSPSGTAVAGWYVNDFTADSVTVQDGKADSTLLLEYDYLYQDEVAHILPDNMKFIAQHGQRLVAASEYAIYPSLLFDSGQAVEFSDETSMEVSDVGGPIVGLCNLGNNLAIFKKNKIFAISGSGPDNQNSGGYSELYEVSHAVGAFSQASICKIPGGVAFAGPAGFYVLTESLQLSFIGESVYNLFKQSGSSTTIKRISYNSKHNYIAFMTSSSEVYVYYVLAGVWTIWQMDLFNSFIDMAIYNGEMVTTEGTCAIYLQTPDLWVDDVMDSSGSVETVYYSFHIETDYQNVVEGDSATNSRVRSVKFTGKYYTGAAYVIDCSYDGTDSYEAINGGTFEDIGNYTVTSTPTATTWPSDKSRFEHFFARQKCASIRVRLRQADGLRGAAFTHMILVVKAGKTGVMSPRNST